MKSIKMTDDRYWDATGLYDSTLNKTQREVNAAQAAATSAKYTKPAGGIPKTDLANGVQASLDKADSAIQQHQSLAAYRTAAAQDAIDEAQDTAIAGKYTKPGTGIPETDLASDAQSKIDNALPKTGDGSNVTAAFTAANNRTNISTGEKLSVIFGKIAKWFADLGSAAFRAATGSITQGSTDLVESGAVYNGLSVKYEKPASGIPASDLASAVQSSLSKADSAVEYSAQTLTDAQKAQARSNIGAANDEEVSDLKSAITLLGQNKNAGSFGWKLKRTIDASGHEVDITGFALSQEIEVDSGLIVTNTTPATGAGNNATFLYVHEFNSSDTWLRRTLLQANASLKLPSDCKKIKLAHGYSSAAGVTITWEILKQYFTVEFCSETVSLEDEANKNTALIKLSAMYVESGTIDNLENLIERCDRMRTGYIKVLIPTTITPASGYSYNLYTRKLDGTKVAMRTYNNQRTLLPGYYYQLTVFKTNGGAINPADFDSIITLGSDNYECYLPLYLASKAIQKNANNPLVGKRLSVLGDSISTYTGWNPSGYNPYYPQGDVNTYTKMYWGLLEQEDGMVIDTINAFGGSTVGTKWQTTNKIPFIDSSRINNLGTPNVIVVFGGTNDYSGNPLGEYVNDGTYTNLYQFRVAYAYLLNQLKQTYPSARILCLTIMDKYNTSYNVADLYPIKQNEIRQVLATDTTTHFMWEFNDSIRAIADHYGCTVVDISDCFNYYNASNESVDPGPDNYTHPNAAVHRKIKNKISAVLRDIL